MRPSHYGRIPSSYLKSGRENARYARGLFVGLVHGHVVLARMVAGGAGGRGFLTLVDVTADQTLSFDDVVALPDGAVLYLFEVAGETVVMGPLDFGYRGKV